MGQYHTAMIGVNAASLKVAAGFAISPAQSIPGGTGEAQRNIVAATIFGLPENQRPTGRCHFGM